MSPAASSPTDLPVFPCVSRVWAGAMTSARSTFPQTGAHTCLRLIWVLTQMLVLQWALPDPLFSMYGPSAGSPPSFLLNLCPTVLLIWHDTYLLVLGLPTRMQSFGQRLYLFLSSFHPQHFERNLTEGPLYVLV